MSKGTKKKDSILRNNGVQTIIGSLLCIVIGLLVGYIVLLIINPSGAGQAIIAILKNFLYYPSAMAVMKYLGTTLVKSSALLMCSLSVLFAWKVGLFNIGVAGQYVIGAGACLYCGLRFGMLALMVLHIADVGIQLPTRLFDEEAGSDSQDVINDEIKDEINDSVTFSGAQLKDGVYEGSAEGYKSTIKVSVTVNNGAVTDIEILEENDTPDFFERAEAIIDDVIDEQTLEVDTVSGATYSSSGILNAVNNALESAVTDGELEKNDVEIPSGSQKGHGGRRGKNRNKWA